MNFYFRHNVDESHFDNVHFQEPRLKYSEDNIYYITYIYIIYIAYILYYNMYIYIYICVCVCECVWGGRVAKSV